MLERVYRTVNRMYEYNAVTHKPILKIAIPTYKFIFPHTQ